MLRHAVAHETPAAEAADSAARVDNGGWPFRSTESRNDPLSLVTLDGGQPVHW